MRTLYVVIVLLLWAAFPSVSKAQEMKWTTSPTPSTTSKAISLAGNLDLTKVTATKVRVNVWENGSKFPSSFHDLMVDAKGDFGAEIGTGKSDTLFQIIVLCVDTNTGAVYALGGSSKSAK
jgi:hypothetical protein